MDWRLEHFLNHLMQGHDGRQDVVIAIVSATIPATIIATLLLWFVGRPGVVDRWRLACASAFGAAALALVCGQIVARIWSHPRPFVSHPAGIDLLTAHTTDAGFPSDHATAAFAIAAAVVHFSRRVGILFLAGAVVIALSRLFAGVHYPIDVIGGAGIGIIAALLVIHTPLQRIVQRLCEFAGRLTDPILGPIWQRLGHRGQTEHAHPTR